MIKSNELRIGNWVNNKNGNTPVQFKSFFGLVNVEKSTEKWEPILLTEEWLLKFGFEKSFDSPFVEYEWQLGKFSLSENLEPHLGMFTGENEFKYVHQLQNLHFALTGEELTIQL